MLQKTETSSIDVKESDEFPSKQTHEEHTVSHNIN
jgi:hypothetical protein